MIFIRGAAALIRLSRAVGCNPRRPLESPAAPRSEASAQPLFSFHRLAGPIGQLLPEGSGAWPRSWRCQGRGTRSLSRLDRCGLRRGLPVGPPLLQEVKDDRGYMPRNRQPRRLPPLRAFQSLVFGLRPRTRPGIMQHGLDECPSKILVHVGTQMAGIHLSRARPRPRRHPGVGGEASRIAKSLDVEHLAGDQQGQIAADPARARAPCGSAWLAPDVWRVPGTRNSRASPWPPGQSPAPDI